MIGEGGWLPVPEVRDCEDALSALPVGGRVGLD